MSEPRLPAWIRLSLSLGLLMAGVSWATVIVHPRLIPPADTGVAEDTGSTGDSGGGGDSGAVGDSGLSDSGAATDSGASNDSGAAGDSGTADGVSPTDTATPDSGGADTGELPLTSAAQLTSEKGGFACSSAGSRSGGSARLRFGLLLSGLLLLGLRRTTLSSRASSSGTGS